MFSKIANFFGLSEKKTVPKRVDGWSNILTGLGIRGRDKSASTTFKACPQFCFRELSELYRADGLTKRIIDIVPAEMLRQGFEVDGDPENAILGRFEELNVNLHLNSLMKWSRLFGGAIIVMGISDGRPLNEPVDENNVDSVEWLKVFDRWQVNISTQYLCCDLNSENFGCPEWYEVNDYRVGATFVVHHSRVLRMDWAELPPRDALLNQGWGDSLLVSIYSELKSYGSALANTETIMQDFVNGVLKMPNLSETLSSGCQKNDSAVMRRLDYANLSKGVSGMMVLDGDETYEKLSTNVSGISDLLDRFMLSLSSVTGIPITLLFGRAPAGLNATGDADIRNFYDMVKQLQETKLKPVLEKLIYYIMISKEGPFGGVEPENWGVQFAPLWQNTEEQEATLRRTVAETDAIYIDRGVVDPSEIAISRFGGDRWSMNTIIDLEARQNGYNQQEIEDLEREKEKQIEKEPPEASIGPNSSDDPDNIIVVT